jgi:hypothetical protein
MIGSSGLPVDLERDTAADTASIATLAVEGRAKYEVKMGRL